MDYYERAKSAYNRQDIVRAAVILAEGLIRDPSNDEGVGWLLRVYVEDLRGPGLERELLRVMERQRNGHDLYRVVCAELREIDQFEKLEALQKVRRQLGLFTDIPDGDVARPAEVPDRNAAAAASTAATTPAEEDADDDDTDDEGDEDEAPVEPAQRRPSNAQAGERWDRFKSPFGADGADEEGDDAPRTTTLRQRSRPLRAVAEDEESLYSRGRSARDKYEQRRRAFVIGGVLLLVFVAVVLYAVLSPPADQAPPTFGPPDPTSGISNPADQAPGVAPSGSADAGAAAPPSAAAPTAAAPEAPPVLAPPADLPPDDGSAVGSGGP